MYVQAQDHAQDWMCIVQLKGGYNVGVDPAATTAERLAICQRNRAASI